MVEDILAFLKWIILGVFLGVIIGFIGVLFHFCIDFATGFRINNTWIYFFLPVGGLIIAWLYKTFGNENDMGTNFAMVAIRTGDCMHLVTAPLVFIGSVITHLVGGSSGREGAALQIGGSIGNKIGRTIRLDEKDMHTITMCGMSAAFSALFGTPITAAVFSMEFISIGIMHYSAFVPCVAAAVTGKLVAGYFCVEPENILLSSVPEIKPEFLIKTTILAALCAFISILFCIIMHNVSKGYKKYIPNLYLRGTIGGFIILAATLLIGNYDYSGGGMNIVERAVEGDVFIFAFFIKMVLTALTIGAGFKGGEIVPTFFIGATFGNAVSRIIGLEPGFGAGIGTIAVFCGVTNCPISSIILSLELFGSEGFLFFAVACAVSYMLSGYTGLYSEQKIIYSKTKTEFIDKKAC